MIYSLNEIDAHCKKAARGAGFAWGHAEEIGKVARWLATYQLQGTSLLVRFLTQVEQSSKTLSAPIITQLNQIQASGNVLCPIQTGCYLADVLSVSSDQEHSFERLGFPLLLLPFLSRLADQAGLSVSYHYDNNQFDYADGKLTFNLNNALTCDQTEHAACVFTTEKVDGKIAQVIGQQISEADWKLLNDYTWRTYVPATEESRRGAGPSE